MGSWEICSMDIPALLAAAFIVIAPVRVGQVSPSSCTLKGISVPGFATASLSREQFAKLHAAVAPSGDGERWMEIPWQTNLSAARKKAQEEGKPLLMWIMDGHPLGCT